MLYVLGNRQSSWCVYSLHVISWWKYIENNRPVCGSSSTYQRYLMADSKRPEAEDGFGVHLNMMLLGCLSCIKYLLFLYYSSLSIEYFSLPFRLQFSTYFWFFPVHQPIGDAVATTFPICVQKATTICKYLSSLLRTNIFTLKNMG